MRYFIFFLISLKKNVIENYTYRIFGGSNNCGIFVNHMTPYSCGTDIEGDYTATHLQRKKIIKIK